MTEVNNSNNDVRPLSNNNKVEEPSFVLVVTFYCYKIKDGKHLAVIISSKTKLENVKALFVINMSK